MDKPEQFGGNGHGIHTNGQNDLRLELAIIDDRVLLNFGQLLSHVKLPAAVARKLGNSLIKHADKLEQSPITIPTGRA